MNSQQLTMRIRSKKKLEEKIEFAGKILVEKPADKLDEIANDTAEDFITAYGEAIEVVKGGWMNE